MFLVPTYGCKTWALNKLLEKRITAFEMKYCRRALRISLTERKSNNEMLMGSGFAENWLVNTIKIETEILRPHLGNHGKSEYVIVRCSQPTQDRIAFREAATGTVFWKGHVI